MSRRSEDRVTYILQRYPALRTTFVRREIRALRELGVDVTVYSIRPALASDIRADEEIAEEAKCVINVPSNPVGWQHIVANALAVVLRPFVWCRLMFLALTGEKGTCGRGRMVLQVWRAAWIWRHGARMKTKEPLHAHFADGACMTAMGVSAYSGRPYSFTSHTSMNPSAIRQKLANARFVASISEYDRGRLLNDLPGDVRNKVHVVHCGIPLEDFSDCKCGQGVLDGRSVRIVSVGALIDKKGHDILIRACGVLYRRGESIECEIMGEGPMRASLEGLIQDEGLQGVVRLAGAVPQKVVRQAVKGADLFALACKTTDQGDTDGIPVAIMEAMALGVPCISTCVAGIPELIEDGVSGYLGVAGDAESFADKLSDAIRSDVRGKEKVARAARVRIESHFSAVGEASKLREIFFRGSGEMC